MSVWFKFALSGFGSLLLIVYAGCRYKYYMQQKVAEQVKQTFETKQTSGVFPQSAHLAWQIVIAHGQVTCMDRVHEPWPGRHEKNGNDACYPEDAVKVVRTKNSCKSYIFPEPEHFGCQFQSPTDMSVNRIAMCEDTQHMFSWTARFMKDGWAECYPEDADASQIERQKEYHKKAMAMKEKLDRYAIAVDIFLHDCKKPIPPPDNPTSEQIRNSLDQFYIWYKSDCDARAPALLERYDKLLKETEKILEEPY